VTDAHPLPPIVREVQPKSAALDAGVKAGDIVTALDGQPIATFDQLPALIAAKAGAPVVVTLWRQGQSFDVTLTPRERDLPDGQGGFTHRWLIGLTGGSLFEPATRHPGLLETARLAAQATWALTTTNVSGIVHILRGTISSCNVSGVIGMAEVVSAAARDGLDAFIQIVAVVSLGIGLMNLLPIPVLDGGHLMFHAWEAIRRRPPSPAAMRLLTSLGLAVLLALMAFAIGNDLTCT
jgi:regulator of sigma E protease